MGHQSLRIGKARPHERRDKERIPQRYSSAARFTGVCEVGCDMQAGYAVVVDADLRLLLEELDPANDRQCCDSVYGQVALR